MNYLLSTLWLFFLISAFNSANNLFHLVFALFTAFFAAPYFIASRAGRGITVNLKFSDMIFAGSTAKVAAEITNTGREEKFMLEFCGASSERYDFDPARIDYLEPYSSKTITLNFNFKKRGLVIAAPLSVKSNIPLLVKEKQIKLEHGKHFIVFARIVRVQFKNSRGADKTSLKKRVFNSDYGELSRFKDYDAGDSPSKINWRHYSISKTLIVPQNEEKNSVNYSIILLLAENYECSSLPYELAVSCASSIAAALNDRRVAFNLITVSDKVKSITSSITSIEKMLSHLALLDSNHTISRTALTRAVNRAHASSDIFVVSSQPFEGLNFLHKYLGGRLRKIIITKDERAEDAVSGGAAIDAAGENETGLVPEKLKTAGSKILSISSLEELSAAAI